MGFGPTRDPGGFGDGDRHLLWLHRDLPALRDVARTREGGLAGLAEKAQLNREHLYRMLSENGNPELRSLEADPLWQTPSGKRTTKRRPRPRPEGQDDDP